jgi:hypothetical protein
MQQLILVIEPDRRQSAKLAMLARSQRAEMIVVASVHEALDTLDERVPDLLLISASLLPKEEALLAERLRELAADGSKVPTLLLPILETPSFRPVARNARGQEICDPTIFAMQISTHLERLAAERPTGAIAPIKRRNVTVLQETKSEPIEYHEIEPVTLTKEKAASTAAPSPPAARMPEWRDLLSALQRDLERMKTENLESTKPVAAAQPRPPVNVARATVPGPATPSAPRTAAQATPASRAVQPPRANTPAAPSQAAPKAAPRPTRPSTPDPAREKKAEKQPPAPARDEWGVYNPDQAGFAALRARLDEMANANKKQG